MTENEETGHIIRAGAGRAGGMFFSGIALRALGGRLLDAVLPPRCPLCGGLTGDGGDFCARCWPDLDFISRPHCHRCGLPFAYDIAGDEENLCGACLSDPPPWTAARSALVYNDRSRPLFLALKHGDRPELAAMLARIMASRFGRDFDPRALVVPVPLHPWRLWRRGYNQAALIAREFARLTGRKWMPDLLYRRRNTPSQGHLNRKARQRNVAGAFITGEKARIEGMPVLLVDDVMTSGATAAACSRCLLAGGAASVAVVTAARVPAEA